MTAMKSGLKITIILALSLLPVGAVLVYGIIKKNSPPSGESSNGVYKEIEWRTLRGLDYETGTKSDELQALSGKFVKIPGFVVPLEDDATGYSEFLLVPSPQACIHVPPPPPNQMIMVRMNGSKAPERSWGPVWLMGKLVIASVDSGYGQVSFQLVADYAEPYQMPNR